MFPTPNTSLLLTGGTGSFGAAFLERVLAAHAGFRRIVVFSRDELKQYELARHFSPEKHPQLEWIIGDVRDQQALERACIDIDIVVHAAALKQVPAGEKHPEEFVKTNIGGTQNLIAAALNRGVRQVLALSTSKAVAPLNLYGATKLCADKMLIAANRPECRFSVLRCGNIFASRGSVAPLFQELKATGKLPVTHPEMTRFHITLDRLNSLAIRVLELMQGGEVFIPASPSYRVVDLATAVAPESSIDWIGVRPGEKLHEEMIPNAEARWTRRKEDLFVQLSPLLPELQDHYADWEQLTESFSYSSESNPEFLNVDDLKRLLKREGFQP